MELTAAQQKYFAYWLTRSLPSDSLGKLTASLQDAQVDGWVDFDYNENTGELSGLFDNTDLDYFIDKLNDWDW